jgi:transcriptional regulator with XRE-family HTH domain
LELASMLRTRRRAIGRDAKTVFESLAVSRNHLSAIENARALPTEKMLNRLIEVLEYDDQDAEYIIKILQIARHQGWWDDYSRYVPSEILDLCGLEYGAEKLRIYDPMVVTGLLQTREYTRALAAANPEYSRRAVDRTVNIRLQRQERLQSSDAPQITVLQGETALHQEIGGPEVLLNQLLHIERMLTTHDSIDLRIQAFASTPVGFATAPTVVLLDFTTPYLNTMAWTESPVSLGITHERDTVEVIELNFDLALESSLNSDASLDLIRGRIAELR